MLSYRLPTSFQFHLFLAILYKVMLSCPPRFLVV